MKKLIVAIVAFVFIATSTGAVLHMHYCMGELADWSLGYNESKTCSKCGMEESSEKDKGCCKDEVKFIKNNADQKTAETGFQMIQVLAIALPVSIIEIPSSDFPSLTEVNPIDYAPPRSGCVAVYIRNCAFLI